VSVHRLPATFLLGGPKRADKPRRYRLAHGDVVVWGGPSRLFFMAWPRSPRANMPYGPSAHQPDFSQSAVIFLSRKEEGRDVPSRVTLVYGSSAEERHDHIRSNVQHH
jgi:hypothetical protein